MHERLGAGYLKEVLKAHKLSPNRMLGQNFLISPRIFCEILRTAAVDSSDTVLEIGGGIGRLTALLADRARDVVSIEIDGGLFRVASDRLAGRDNVCLLHRDLLKSKHMIDPDVTRHVRRLCSGNPVKVVANLPYQISSPAIINLLEWEQPVSTIHVMLQREVAERLTAGPGGQDYGPLTVFARYGAKTRIIFRVPPSAFMPSPAVESAFVALERRRPEKKAENYALFARVVNVLFQNRRKTLRKVLKREWGKEACATVLEKADLEGMLRPEKLEVSDFVRLANALPGAR